MVRRVGEQRHPDDEWPEAVQLPFAQFPATFLGVCRAAPIIPRRSHSTSAPAALPEVTGCARTHLCLVHYYLKQLQFCHQCVLEISLKSAIYLADNCNPGNRVCCSLCCKPSCAEKLLQAPTADNFLGCEALRQLFFSIFSVGIRTPVEPIEKPTIVAFLPWAWLQRYFMGLHFRTSPSGFSVQSETLTSLLSPQIMFSQTLIS